MSRDGLVALRSKDSKVVMLLTNSMDPSKLWSVERRQKETWWRLKVPCPAIIKEYNSQINGAEIHDQLKTSYGILVPQIKVPVLSNFLWPHGFSCCQCPCHSQRLKELDRIVQLPVGSPVTQSKQSLTAQRDLMQSSWYSTQIIAKNVPSLKIKIKS